MGQVWVSRALTCWSFLRIFGIHFRPMVQEEVFVYIMILCSFQSWRYNHDSTISFMCVFVETAGGFAKHVILHRLLTLKSSAQLEWESIVKSFFPFVMCRVFIWKGVYILSQDQQVSEQRIVEHVATAAYYQPYLMKAMIPLYKVMPPTYLCCWKKNLANQW